MCDSKRGLRKEALEVRVFEVQNLRRREELKLGEQRLSGNLDSNLGSVTDKL